MPMKAMPPVTSNRAPSAFQKYMSQAAARPSPTGLSSVRSAALQNTNVAPMATPAMRQANTPGPAETTSEDLAALTREYNNWSSQMKARGATDHQIAVDPMFQNYQDRIVAATKGIKSQPLLDQQIGEQQGRVDNGANSDYQPSAQTILAALKARNVQLSPPPAAKPATPAPGDTVIPDANGGLNDPSDIYSGIHPEVMQQIIASAGQQTGVPSAVPTPPATPQPPVPVGRTMEARAPTPTPPAAPPPPPAPVAPVGAAIKPPAPPPSPDMATSMSKAPGGTPSTGLANVSSAPTETPWGPAKYRMTDTGGSEEI